MKPSRFLYIVIFSIFLICFSCKKDPVLPNPEELITTLIYTLTPTGSQGSVVVMTFRDLDGDGGNAPLITYSGPGGDSLVTGVTYTGVIELLNESASPITNITEEIEAEDEDHQFFYTINGMHATIEYSDQDDSGFPVGLNTTMTAAGPGNGNIKIILRHLPDKGAAGVSDGLIQNAGGETDIEVTFPQIIVP